MAVTFSRVILSDGKPAIQVDGLPNSPLYVRVRLLSRQAVRGDSGGCEIALKAEGYRVDATGAPALLLDGSEDKAPAISRTINGSALANRQITLVTERASLLQDCLRQYVEFHNGLLALAAGGEEMVE